MEEIWKDIPGYEGIYQISNMGNARSLDRITFDGRKLRSKPLKQFFDKDGYMKVGLCKNNNVKQYRVHRLVAIAFIDNPNYYSQINHKDENKTNNSFINLEWCDCKYNINYGTRTKKVVEATRGENKWNHKLTENDVKYIRENYGFRDKKFDSIHLGKMFF